MKTKSFTQSWLIRPLAVMTLMTGLSLGQIAQAKTLNDFTWSISAGGDDGFVENGEITIGATTATIRGSDTGFGFPTTTSMTTTTTEAGTVSFDWLFNDFNINGPGYNFLIWLNDGLGDGDQIINSAVTSESGSSSFLVGVDILSGITTFGMAIYADLDFDGPAIAEISNFNFSPSGQPGVVPLPPAFLLFGSAIAGLGFMRKYKQARV